ncbi:MAG: phage tail tape measure protein [Syntrophomonadaceae bacterium]|nr:phage tail tape measure protein [Syntrophomonadaceae bacterium]
MAGKIKGITIEIGGDTQPLQKALGDVNKKSREIQSELKEVEKLLKLDPKNTELVAQKQKLLSEAVTNSKEKLDRLKMAQEQVNEQFKKGEISEEQYRAFQREVAKAEQELTGFEKKLESTAKASKTLGEKLQDAGGKMKSAGETMTKYVTVPLAAAGAGLLAAGKTIDEAYDKIRIGTGATGKALEGLQNDFDNVAKRVPSNFDDISTVIADYNTRLNISGKVLQDLSVQTLNLARVTKSDLSKTIEETSQSFQAFNVPVQKYGEYLDYIFKVSQSTGIAIDRLLSNLVKFSPALKGMGFDFQESAALMGYFDKAGVEVEQAMTGLNKALVNMAKAGVTDASEALNKLFAEIKGAPSDIKATELAIEVFGAKAGPLMAAAIRDGKLEYAALLKELVGSKETINGVAKETDDFAERLAQLKNNILIVTKPISTTFFDALDELMPLLERAVPTLEKLADSFANLPKGAQMAILAIAGIVALIGPLLQGIGTMVIAGPGLIAMFGKIKVVLIALISPLKMLASVVIPAVSTALTALAAVVGVSVGWLIAIIVGLIAAGVLIYKNWDEIKAFVLRIWEDLKTGLSEGFASMKKAFTDFGTQIAEGWAKTWNGIKSFFETWGQTILLIAVGPAGWAVLLAQKLGISWEDIRTTSSRIWEGIKNAIVSPIETAKEILLRIIDSIKKAFANMKIEIPKPKLPNVNVTTKYKTVGNIDVPYPAFNWYDKGGIFTKPAIIGIAEKRPEFVGALDDLRQIIRGELRGTQLATAGNGGNIVIQNMYVRNDQDIKSVARELYKLQNSRGRGLGMA